MENAVADLLSKFGYGSIWTLIGILIMKYAIKPAFDTYLEFKKEKNKQLLQSKIDQENNIQSSVLEFDKYKKDLVLPILQNIANILERNHTCMQDYCTFIANDYFIKEDKVKLNNINKYRENLLEELKNNLRSISIYLPKEIKIILLSFHVSIEKCLLSTKYIKPIEEKETDSSFEAVVVDINRNIMKIYLLYLQCFYALVEKYIEITPEKKDYLLIFKEHSLNENGELISNDEVAIYCAVDILGFNRMSKQSQEKFLETVLFEKLF